MHARQPRAACAEIVLLVAGGHVACTFMAMTEDCMKRLLVAITLMFISGAISAAEITLFEHDSLNGRRLPSNGNIPNLANTGFNDVASSVIVRSGTWQLCDDAYFRGHCVTLAPGQYP